MTLDDARELAEARVSLARANARPCTRPPTTTSRSRSPTPTATAPAPGVVRSALRILDDRSITGRTWARRHAHPRRGPRRRTATAPRARGVLRDEDDLQLLAELGGVLDQTVGAAGLSAGSYLVLRELVAAPGPQPGDRAGRAPAGRPGGGGRRSAGAWCRPTWRGRAPTASR